MGFKSAIKKYKGKLQDIYAKRVKEAEERAKADVEKAKTKTEKAKAKERLKQEKLALKKEIIEAKIATQKAANAVVKAQKEAKDLGARRGDIQGKIADFGDDLQRAGKELFREIYGRPAKRGTAKRKKSRKTSGRNKTPTSMRVIRR